MTAQGLLNAQIAWYAERMGGRTQEWLNHALLPIIHAASVV